MALSVYAAAPSFALVPAGEQSLSLDNMVLAWLDSKQGKSDSQRTYEAYKQIMAHFRAALAPHGLDLNGESGAVATVAQVWARQRADGRDGHAAASTINQRLAALSSFYAFARRRRYLTGENPITLVERATVQAYAHARALPQDELQHRLSDIDLSTLEGKRDYALLLVALGTGRRRAELAALLRGDLVILSDGTGERVLVTWQRCKGGKTMHDELTGSTAAALLRYLHAAYGPAIATLPHDAPIWLALSRNHHRQALGRQAIANIYARRLGSSKVHASRHTFARYMEEAGAKVSIIQARLGHTSLATTGRYLAALTSADNPYAARLEDMYGVADREPITSIRRRGR